MNKNQFGILCGISLIAIISSSNAQQNKNIKENSVATIKGATMNDEIKPQLDWVPAGKPIWHPGWMNGYVRGLELVLNKKGIAVDYNTLMGDIGQAFIMQGEENSTNKIDGAADVGWWPLELLGFMRLNFVEKTVGREIFDIKLTSEEVRSDRKKAYETRFKPAILSSLQNGDACIAVRIDDAEYIVTGCDNNEHPLIGMCTNTKEGEVKIARINAPVPPYALLTIGKSVPIIDRKTADKEALKFAIALHRDQVLGPDIKYSGTLPLRHLDGYKKYWRTGKKSFEAWISVLEDSVHYGQSFWHSNSRNFLENNRITAVRYLQEMQKRYSGEISACISKAIDSYNGVISETRKLDTSEGSIKSIDGRKKIVTSIKTIETLEDKAISELEIALTNMK